MEEVCIVSLANRLDLDLDRIRRRIHPSVVIIATGRGGSTGDLKCVGSADCRCKDVSRGSMKSFFTKMVPFVDCSDEERVSNLFCLACRYNVSSAVVDGLSDY